MQTTDNRKKSVFTQSTSPPTAGRKIGDVWFDTSRDNLMHRFDGTKWVESKWGEQSIVANSITANHIKSLVGLNVNDQFIVDSQGNVKFAGHLEGASGTFSGNLSTEHIVIGPPSPELYFWVDNEPSTIELKNPIRVSDDSYMWGNPFLIKVGNNNARIIPPAGGMEIEAVLVCNRITADTIRSKSFDTPLWTGQAFPLDTQTIIPSKKLTDCMTGWILRWQTYTPGTGTSESNFQYTIVPKVHAEFKDGYGIRVPLGLSGSTSDVVNKYIYVYNDRIEGHANNNQYGSENRALTGVFEF